MARYRKRRFYKRKNGKWSPNIQEISNDIVNLSTGAFSRDYTLAFNPTQVNTAVSQVYTVKNFEVTFTVEGKNSEATGDNDIEDLCVYIMYVPQGMTITPSYNNQHPEYIMAYKFIGSPSFDRNQQYQPIKIRTRLSRTLQTGDSIILFLKGNNTSTEVVSNYELHGLVRWWTKAN